MDAKERRVINMKTFKDIVLYVENFHFAYTSILSKGTNRVDKHYSSFAIKLRNSQNQHDSEKAVSDLKNNLEPHYPSYMDFKTKFTALTYSKKENPSNMKTKYALNKLMCLFEKKELFDDNGSVEHILPETEGLSLNIGNLILLERDINVKANNETYVLKKPIYEESNYKWVKEFIDNHDNWDENAVTTRAEELAEIYYKEILGRAM